MILGLNLNSHDGVSDKSNEIEVPLDTDGAMVGSYIEEVSQLGKSDEITQSSSGVELTPVEGDEPYLGQEFESEAVAHAFYKAYATRVGFITRVSKLSRSSLDRSIIARTLVCNKEGHRKRDRKTIKPRSSTRMGCKAMISTKKLSTGKWVVTKIITDHTHELTPGKGRKALTQNQFPNEHIRIRELTQQLTAERKRSASYRRIVDLLFSHIDEHTQLLSDKIRYIVDSVKEDASEAKTHQDLR